MASGHNGATPVFPSGMQGPAGYQPGNIGGTQHRFTPAFQIPYPGVRESRHRYSSPGNRHGSASAADDAASAPASIGRYRGRDRERDLRRDRTMSPAATTSPTRRMPQHDIEREDRDAEIDNRFETIENLLRRHAQDIAGQQQTIVQLQEMLVQASEKIGSLDNYAQAVDQRITTACKLVEERYEPAVRGCYERIHHLEQMVQQLMDGAVPPPPPGFQQNAQHHHIGSPGPEPPSSDGLGGPPNSESPWERLRREGFQGPQPTPTAPTGPQGAQGGMGMPASAPQANVYHTQVPMGQAQQVPTGGHAEINSLFRLRSPQQAFVGQGGEDIMRQFKINRKHVSPNFTLFTGANGTFKDWREYLADHCAESTRRWKRILEVVRLSSTPLNKALLESTPIGQGYTAWDLSEDLEAFMKKYIHKDLRSRIFEWTGGEEGNGFEMLRRMFDEYEGGCTLVKMGGRRVLNMYGRCDTKSDVLKHYAGWLELLQKHGSDLLTNHEELYYRALEILPEAWEDEVVDDKTIKTHHDIHEFIKRRCIYKRYKAQAKTYVSQHQKDQRKYPINMVGAYEDRDCNDAECRDDRCRTPQVKDIVAATIAALNNSSKGPKSGPPKPGEERFWFDKDCFECGKDGHTRKDCPEYKQILQKNNGKRPQGHQGAFEKARAAWRKKHPRKPSTGPRSRSTSRDSKGERRSKPMKPMLSEKTSRVAAGADSDSDSSCDSEGESAQMQATRQRTTGMGCLRPGSTGLFQLSPKPNANRFHVFRDDDGDDHKSPVMGDDWTDLARAREVSKKLKGQWTSMEPEDVQDVKDGLKGWCKVKEPKNQRRTKNKSNHRAVTVESEDDVAKLFAMPTGGYDHDALIAAAKMCPTEDLQPGETYALMDSGAGCHAAKKKKHFKRHRLVKSEIPQKVVLADGSEITSNGVVDALVMIGGELHRIPYEDLPVECPIISVRQIVRKRNKVIFKDKGGYIYNAKTGKKLEFIEKNGVCFINMKIIQPEDEARYLEPVFSRPGP